MSRHEIPALDPNHRVVVGWDHPLLTFFAQVFDRAKEAAGGDDYMILWSGTRPRELYEIDALAREIRQFARLSLEIKARLYGDKDEGL